MISYKSAGNTLLFIFGLLFIFHLLILFHVLPYDIVWAGKINDREQLVKFESVSIIILMLSTVIVAQKLGYLNFAIKPKVTQIGIWILFAFFTLNTIGNSFAKNPIEKYGFGFLTFVMMLLILRIAIATKKNKS